MIVVFNQLPMRIGPVSSPLTPAVTRAATAAAEVTNTIQWLILN